MPRGTGGGQHGSSSIFQRMRLAPGQLRTVADRRFGDAWYLRMSQLNARANGVIYLGGFVIECLLKASLLEKHRWLQTTRSPERLASHERHLWLLCYKWHDLQALLEELPEVLTRLKLREIQGRPGLIRHLKQICAEWTVFARYSPQSATIGQARDFLEQVREVKTCLS